MLKNDCWPLMLCRPIFKARGCPGTAPASVYMLIGVFVRHGEQQGRFRELHNPCRLQPTRHGGEEEHTEAHHATFNTAEHTK